MTKFVGDFDKSQGKPSLTALQYLQANWGPDEIHASVRTCKTVVTGSAGVVAAIPVGAEIIGARSICLKSNGSGSMTVKTGAASPVAITDALQCATIKEVDYAAQIDTAYNIVGSDGIKIFGNGAADYGVVYIIYTK